MWQQYRKTFVLIQLFVCAACASMYFVGGVPLAAVLAIFAMMQAGGLASAAFAARARARMERDRGDLPLRRRR